MKIELSEILSQISEQLIKAHNKAAERGDAVMHFSECEIELALAGEKEGSGGFNLWAVDLSAGVKRTESNTIRVKFQNIAGQILQAPATTEGSGPELRRQTGL